MSIPERKSKDTPVTSIIKRSIADKLPRNWMVEAGTRVLRPRGEPGSAEVFRREDEILLKRLLKQSVPPRRRETGELLRSLLDKKI